MLINNMKLKNKFNRDGYIKIDTKIGYSQRFSFLSNKFDLLLKSELEKKKCEKFRWIYYGKSKFATRLSRRFII